MIEAKIEKIIVDKIDGILKDAGIENFQIIGSYDVSEIKATAQAGKTSYIVVKVSPRTYSSPTIPTCSMECAVSLTVRADVDYNGKTYLDITDLLMGQYETWQKCLDDVHTDFVVQNFLTTGFVLGGGTTTIDQTATTYQYTHNFTVYGIVN